MKPISATDILRRNAPRDLLGRSFAHNNRYEFLREPSPCPSLRNRSDSTASQKRKADVQEVLHEDVQTSKKVRMLEEDAVAFACMKSSISKVTSLCDKIRIDIQKSDIESDDNKSILSDICDALRHIATVQDELCTRMSDLTSSSTVSEPQKSYNGGKKSYSDAILTGSSQPAHTRGRPLLTRGLPAGGLRHKTTNSRGEFPNGEASDQEEESPEETKKRKFAEAIKDAEKSTLCFNLNMGNVPLQNKGTIQEKASLALTAMAAKGENRNSSVPSNDAITAIDDFTSMVTNMEFYGSSTKQYKGKEGGTFCTVPVKYQFKDRDTRVFAEKTLREVCKVQCATPYPAVVRECIKQVVDRVKASHPDQYVKVSVLTRDFALRVARRPKGKDLDWIYLPSNLPLPEEALDVSLKKVPEGLRMPHLPYEDEEPYMDASTTPDKTTTDKTRPPPPPKKGK